MFCLLSHSTGSMMTVHFIYSSHFRGHFMSPCCHQAGGGGAPLKPSHSTGTTSRHVPLQDKDCDLLNMCHGAQTICILHTTYL